LKERLRAGIFFFFDYRIRLSLLSTVHQDGLSQIPVERLEAGSPLAVHYSHLKIIPYNITDYIVLVLVQVMKNLKMIYKTTTK
jgi:hypothetical protein